MEGAMRWRPVVLMLAVSLAAMGCGGEQDGADDEVATAEAESTEPADTVDAAVDSADPAPADPAPAESAGAPSDDTAADGDLDDEVQELLDDLDFGDGGARVVLGDRTYEFTFGGNSPVVDGTTYLGSCQTLFGAIAGTGYELQDDGVVTIEFELPPEDWESYEDGRFDTTTPRIKIEDIATEEAWIADMTFADLYPEVAGVSQVDEWVLDSATASGAATFTAIQPWSAPVEGTEPLQGTFELGCAND